MTAEPARVLLVGEVGTTITAAGMDRILRQAGPRPLDITLRSAGGCAMHANTIFHRLREHANQYPVTITAADALSAGAWILLAGDRRIIAKNATVMVHNVLAGETVNRYATPTQLRETASTLDGMTALLGDIIADRTGLERARCFELMESECHLNAARAIELGFAHEICDPIY